MQEKGKLAAAGAIAGAVNGFFGAGGGMVLVPLLGKLCDLKEEELFPASIRIMLPVCLVSLLLTEGKLPFKESLPYLAGSLAGGLISLKCRCNPKWLHRILGVLILIGGGRMLWS